MKRNKTYLVVDTETGGLNPYKNSILSCAGVLWKPGKMIKPIFNFYVREKNIVCEQKALEVNKIDLRDVENGLTPLQAVEEIRRSLNENFGKDRKSVTLVGHNIPFDVSFIKRMYRLAGNKNYSRDFHNRAIDTASILEFLILSGKVDAKRASADVLFESAGVKIKDVHRHTALGDAIATANAMENLIS